MTVEDPLLAGALAAVRAAGDVALGFFRGAHRRWEKGPGQIVTEADIAVDGLLRRSLGELLPDAGWLSEETVDDGSRLARRRAWVVDPIDGTRSFAAGKPEFTVCVALVEDGAPVLGLVLNPATGELFRAVRGGGAFLDDASIHARDPAGLAGARIGISSTERHRDALAAALPGAEPIAIGSLAYKLVLIAAGRLDGYVSRRRAHDWDIAAAELVMAEAGAVLTDAAGSAISYGRAEPWRQGLIAAAPQLHRELVARLATG
ncbi:MAG TPA: 3'(2'),5'-bisphosphate nucleotidase CysQ [Geminicoccaceae bacterium]|nr:3'(2'),5'-bisphosphate nucleotidase CysQ [Geminicoccus sp.]HMU51280.1 3'(2'),5'-bisphosphate nucleotidase CysQ [Geminicoccaceae bacterium]